MLDLLFADRKLGAASKLAFLMLWRFAGEKPGRIVVTADWLAGQCGRSPRAAWDWLAELERHDVVKLGERNERRGSVVVDVYNPAPGSREAIPDAQTRLPIGNNAEPADAEPSRAPVSPAETVSGVFAPKPPRPLVPKKQESISSQSTNVIKEPTQPKNSTSQREPSASMGDALAAVLVRFESTADPARQKEALKRRIVAACGRSTPCADWVAGSLAGLVAYHDVPVEDVNRILGDLDAMRSAGSLRHAGKFVHAKARELAGRLGKPWPRREAVA